MTVVNFRSAQATGSAKGAYYDSNQNELQLKSDVHIVTTGDKAAVITGNSGVIQKEPRQAILMGCAHRAAHAHSDGRQSHHAV